MKNMKEVFNSYSQYIRKTFGERVQKISVDGGFTCPNRDGVRGRGGCTYCNNETFNPVYTSAKKSITKQLDEGVAFFAPKYKTQQYLAYFQAYTNTYTSVERLEQLYTEALSHPKVIGLSISTRPDAINEEVVFLLERLAKDYYIAVELGIESTIDASLEKINRCHTFDETQKAYEMLNGKGLHLGGHLIIGLPGETKKDFVRHAKEVSELPIEFLKLHQLQIIKGTIMEKEYDGLPDKFDLLSVDAYVEIISEFLQYLRPDMILERFSSESPKELLIAPIWGGLKNFEITDRIRKRMIKLNTVQGDKYRN
jgi:radical SAM protein (TIGR01212 family)